MKPLFLPNPMKNSEFLEFIVNILEPAGKITSRRMFGGYGIYNYGITFALIYDNTLYFKVNEQNIDDFKNVDSQPFTYNKKGKEISLSYWKISEDLLEDQEELVKWAKKAYEAACSSKKRKK